MMMMTVDRHTNIVKISHVNTKHLAHIWQVVLRVRQLQNTFARKLRVI